MWLKKQTYLSNTKQEVVTKIRFYVDQKLRNLVANKRLEDKVFPPKVETANMCTLNNNNKKTYNGFKIEWKIIIQMLDLYPVLFLNRIYYYYLFAFWFEIFFRCVCLLPVSMMEKNVENKSVLMLGVRFCWHTFVCTHFIQTIYRVLHF